jgi:beta-lactamase regulating signal transducer with metallopeptidase domain
MALLGQSAFLKALGWALLNSIWQMAILWLVYLLLSASLRKLTADIKHSVAILLLGAGFIWFGSTLAIKYLDYSESPTIVSSMEEITAGLSFQSLELALPYLSSLYLLVTLFLFFRFVSQYRYTKYVSTHATHKLKPELRLYVRQIAERMGIKKNVQVWLSEIVDTPMTIGFWKPIILMPIASVNGLSTQQVEAILLHELSHIRRNDYLVNLMIATIDVVLFFNPFSRLFIRTIKKEREHSCDDLVLQFEYHPHAYASALLAIEKRRMLKVSLAMAATGKNNRMLLDRVKRILNQPVSTRYNNRMVAHLFAGSLMAFIAWSNPGNVIVKNILQPEPQPALVIIEDPGPVFVSNGAPRPNQPPSVKEEVHENQAIAPLEEDIMVATAYDDEETDEEPGNIIYTAAIEGMQQGMRQGLTEYYAPTIVQVNENDMRDFSITEQPVTEKPITVTVTPFVPSTSFSYYVQDSTKPGKIVVSQQEKSAKEALRQALKALDEIDWSSLEKDLKESGEKIDIAKLQEEIKKSLKKVDWEKVNAESKLEALQMEAEARKTQYLRELTTNSRQATQMQQHYQNLEKKILEDHIKCQQEQQIKQEELKKHLQKKSKPVKKTVHI